MTGCKDMEYQTKYETLEINQNNDLPIVNINIEPIAEKAPNIYILECNYVVENISSINAVSCVIKYDPNDIKFIDEINVKGKYYKKEYNTLNPNTFGEFYDEQFRYSYFTVYDNYLKEDYICRFIIEIINPTTIYFSGIPGEVEFANCELVLYPIKYKNIIIEKL